MPGFIVNRLAYAMYREAIHLVEAGVADVATIDRSCRNAFGLWASIMGPFQWMDLTGGPNKYAKAMKNVLPTLDRSTDVRQAVKRITSTSETNAATHERFYPPDTSAAEKADALFRMHVWNIRRLSEEYGVYSGPAEESAQKNR